MVRLLLKFILSNKLGKYQLSRIRLYMHTKKDQYKGEQTDKPRGSVAPIIIVISGWRD